MRKGLLLLLVGVAALSAGAAPGLADAATIVVNSTADGSLAGHCTLRDAIKSAVFDSSYAGCLSGDHDDTITFAIPAGSTITLSEGELVLPSAVVEQNIDVQGPGADRLTISGNGASRVFHVSHGMFGAVDSISGLTIAGGKVQGGEEGLGGGLLNEGMLTLTGVVVERNEAKGTGSSLAIGNGGGIANTVVGSLTIARSTVAGNTAGAVATSGFAYADGGGVFNEGALTVADSTIAANGAIVAAGSGQSAGGGGIATTSAMKVTSSTVVGNTVASGILRSGANILGSGTSELENTIVAEPEGASDCSTALVSLGFNLEDEDSCGFHQSTDQPSTDPKLAAAGLADNGGPTPTIALEPGSPALDQGLASPGETTDQRGLPRPVALPGLTAPAVGDHADIGAFEQQLPEPPEPTHPGGGEPAGGGGGQSGGGGGPSSGGGSPTPPVPAPTPKLTVTIGRLRAKPGARQLTIRFRADLPGSHFECALDVARPRPCTSPYRTKKLTIGRHAFSVLALADGQRSRRAKASFRVR
jgi:CSLREA domain-containing protein